MYRYLDNASRDLDMYPLNARLRFPALLAQVVRDKVHIKKHILEAYRSADPRHRLAHLSKTLIETLRSNLNLLWKYHRDHIWLSTFKPFGLEILELRYGAIRTRTETLQDRVDAFCRFEIDSIPELEGDLKEEVYPGFGMDLVFDFARSYTPSRALGTG